MGYEQGCVNMGRIWKGQRGDMAGASYVQFAKVEELSFAQSHYPLYQNLVPEDNCADTAALQRRTFVYGERQVDRMDFEELALKSLDPSLGPSLTRLGHSESDIKPEDNLTVSLCSTLNIFQSQTIDAAFYHPHNAIRILMCTLCSFSVLCFLLHSKNGPAHRRFHSYIRALRARRRYRIFVHSWRNALRDTREASMRG